MNDLRKDCTRSVVSCKSWWRIQPEDKKIPGNPPATVGPCQKLHSRWPNYKDLHPALHIPDPLSMTYSNTMSMQSSRNEKKKKKFTRLGGLSNSGKDMFGLRLRLWLRDCCCLLSALHGSFYRITVVETAPSQGSFHLRRSYSTLIIVRHFHHQRRTRKITLGLACSVMIQG